MTKQSAGCQSFINLLETIADNKYVLGDRLVEVGVSGPTLSATLAAIAMAQGELGHARLLYTWAADLKGWKGKKLEIEKQSGKAFQGMLNVCDWITLIAASYTFHTALDAVLKSLLEGNHPDVITRVHKMTREQREHLMYSRNWAVQLCREQGAIPRRFRKAMEQIVPEVEEWLQSVERKVELAEEEYWRRNSLLLQSFHERIHEVSLPEGIGVH
jgi:ring-1,2-phenylacetyl-CoA epoxidase subunit PaaC